MSFRLVAHTPTLGAAPGESVIGRVEIYNDGSTDAVYTIAVVGLAPDAIAEPAPAPVRLSVPAKSSATGEVVVAVPRTLGIGQHAAAFEATSNRPGDRATLTPFTVSIQSVSRVELVPQPSTIRARRKADFHLDVTNNELLPVDVELIGEAPDVDVVFTPSAMTLQPGQRNVAKGRVRGPRHWSGETTQHNLLITARGRASTTSVTAAYVQRPLFAHRARMVLAALTVVALWLAAIGGVALWLSNRDDATDASAEIVGVDTNGDGVPDVFFDASGRPITATDTDGDGIPDSFVDADGNPITDTDTNGDGFPDTIVDRNGNPITAVDTNGDGKPDTLSNGPPLPGAGQEVTAPEPQVTILRGTVDIDGDPTAVAIALTPVQLGAAPSPTATPIGLRAAQPTEPQGKIWSARTSTLDAVTGTTRRTVAIAADQTTPGADGVWLFTDVLQGQSYEVSFSSPGYDTQSFVLTPRADGEPIDLDVEMKPAKGSLSGTVIGPSGPLGAAEIRITDGTLDFSTTSASGNGTWSLQGVSTPGVYTITSTLRGFATAVRQVTLGPGDQPTGIDLQMVQGLGTITGRITSQGSGLGGVTVTASNGDTTLTTTTLTEGDVGFYSLPQLTIPATYTVKAELDGFVTDSRRVPLAGSLPGVDFSMTSTTATLRGSVLSSTGGGINGAGLIVSTGDLQFRSSTAPDGSFNIDRLPPGDYTITAEHFEHSNVTEFTTLTAGTTSAPLNITLPRNDGPPAIGNGSLVVSVINEDSKIVPAGINNARVTLSRNRTTQTWVLQDPDSSAVTFEDLPIGTYTINVRADGYNLSAPVTRSVGQTQQRAEIRLQRLGQASGTMVNSIGRATLIDYTVTLFRLASLTDATGGVPVGSFPGTTGTWTTPPNLLAKGFYRIEASSPPGFLVRNDQILDPLIGRPMTFEVPEVLDAEVEAIVIPAIEADPYPTITGKIYQPRLNGVTVDYIAIDNEALAVTGTCNGTPVPPADIDITDEFGSTNPADDLFDTFTITKETVAALIPAASLPGNCQFTVSLNTPGYTGATISLPNIVPSNGSVLSDRLAAAAIVKTPESLTGTVFWFDKGRDPDTREPLGGVAITTAAPAITGFTSSESSASIPDPRPIAKLGPLSATSAAGTGEWTLDGQVFGVSTYTFTAPNFTPGSVPVTISEAARVVPPAGTNANVTTGGIDGTGFGIELTPPAPGTVSGKVRIKTTRSTPNFAGAVATGVAPSGPNPAPAIPNGTGDFSFAGAFAGTWKVSFATPTNHQLTTNLGATPPGSVTNQLLPGGSVSGFDAGFIELGTVRVKLFDKSNPATPITADAGIELIAPTGPFAPVLTGPIPRLDPPAGPDGTTNEYVLTGIPVGVTASTDPASTLVDYRLKLQLDDYDLTTVTTAPLGAGPIVDPTNLPVAISAGTDTTISLWVDSFKEITGSIEGLQTVGPPIDLPLSGPADLTAIRISDNRPGEVLPGATPGSFRVVGPAGTYRLTPSHPDYQAFTPVDVVLSASTGTALPAPFQLTLNTSILSVDAVTTLATLTDVADAVVDRYLGTTPCTSFPAPHDPAQRVTIPTLGAAEIELPPGDYCLAINKFDPGTGAPIAFPAIVQVSVPTSQTGAPAKNRATVVAPLPALNPSVTGTLVARNTNPTPGLVELLAPTAPPDAPKLTSVFTSNVSVAVNGTTIPNETPNASGSREVFAEAPTTCTPAGCAWTFEFEQVPAGMNRFTAPVIPGYTLVTAPQNLPIAAMGPTAIPEFVYTAANAAVEIDLGPGTYPSLDPAFVDTDSRAPVCLTAPGAPIASPCTVTTGTVTLARRNVGPVPHNFLTITDVAPQLGAFSLRFDDALHANFTGSVTLDAAPVATGESLEWVGTLASNPVADLVRVTGRVTQQSGPDPSVTTALSGAGASMVLAASPGGAPSYTLTPAAPILTNAKLVGKSTFSLYYFDVAPGTYSLTTSNTDFVPRQLTGLALSPLGNVVAGQDVALRKQGSLSVRALNRGLTLPTGLSVRLLTVGTSDLTPAQTLPSGTNPTVTFSVPANTYSARTVALSTPPYPQQTAPTPDPTVSVGTSSSVDLPLARISRFTVTGPTTTITVTLPSVPVQTGSAGVPIEFVETTTGTGLVATVSAAGFRTQQVNVADSLYTNNPVTLLPTTVTGTINAANEALGNVLTATAGDGTVLQGSITGNTYRVEGLTPGAGGAARDWTIRYNKPGVAGGSSTTAITVNAAGPTANASGTIAGPTVTVAPRPVNYNFTVSASPNGNNAQVTITPAPVVAPPNTNGTGTTTGVVNENVSFSWTVKKAGFLTRYGTAGPAATFPNVDIPTINMVAGVSGTVIDGPGGSGVLGASMALCPSAAATPTDPGCVPLSASGASGAFTITNDLAPNTYKVWASTALVPAVPAVPGSPGPPVVPPVPGVPEIPAKRGSTMLTIAGNGDASLAGPIAIVPIP